MTPGEGSILPSVLPSPPRGHEGGVIAWSKIDVLPDRQITAITLSAILMNVR